MNTKVAIELGEKEFSVEVRELTHEERKSFAEKFKVEQNKVEAYSSAGAHLRDLTEQYETNKALLLNADMPLTDKIKMLWEQKTLLLEIRSLRPCVEAKAKETVLFEDIAKEQFELIVGGENKTALMKEIESFGKSYREILSIILPKVAEAKEKKFSSS